MTGDDVSIDEMGTNRRDEEDELEQLLEGSDEAREQLRELATFVDDLRTMPAATPGVEGLHVAAMMSEASRLLADKGDPVARPVSKAHGSEWQTSGLPTRRSITMRKPFFKVMAPLVAVFTVMGGLAYAQALPDPLQNAVAGAGGVIGLDLPSSDGGDLETSDDEALGSNEDADDDSAALDSGDDPLESGDEVEEPADHAAGTGHEDENDGANGEDDQGEDDQGEDADGDGAVGDDDQGEDQSGQGSGGHEEEADQHQDEADEDHDGSSQDQGDTDEDASGSGGSDGSGGSGDED